MTCKLSGTEEIKNTVRVLFESWLTTGPYTFEFKFKFVKSGYEHFYYGQFRLITDDLNNFSIVMNQTFWIGVWPRLVEVMSDYVTQNSYDLLGGKK